MKNCGCLSLRLRFRAVFIERIQGIMGQDKTDEKKVIKEMGGMQKYKSIR